MAMYDDPRPYNPPREQVFIVCMAWGVWHVTERVKAHTAEEAVVKRLKDMTIDNIEGAVQNPIYCMPLEGMTVIEPPSIRELLGLSDE